MEHLKGPINTYKTPFLAVLCSLLQRWKKFGLQNERVKVACFS